MTLFDNISDEAAQSVCGGGSSGPQGIDSAPPLPSPVGTVVGDAVYIDEGQVNQISAVLGTTPAQAPGERDSVLSTKGRPV